MEKRNMIISASANTLRNALSEARRVASLDINSSREVLRSGGEDGCYRVHLADSNIVEVTVLPGTRAAAHITCM